MPAAVRKPKEDEEDEEDGEEGKKDTPLPPPAPSPPLQRHSMSDYGALPTNGAGAGIKKDAFADAVQRARQIAAKIGGDAVPPMSNNGGAESYPFPAQKRSLEDADQPEAKKLASQNDRDSAMSYGFDPALVYSSHHCYRVPDGMVGLIIGRGGEQINKIQQDSGCKVQIAPDSGGLPERSVSLTGTADAIQLILLYKVNGNPVERAGVKMILIQDGSQPPNIDKPLRIIGDPYKVQQAKEMVNEILRERDHAGFGERNEYGSRMGGGGGGIDVPVPRHSVGVVIGRNGEMIKKIQNDAGVRIQFKPDDGVGPEKIAHVMGPPDRCEHAVSIINDLLQSIRGPPGPPGTGMPPGGRGRGRGQGSWGPPGGEMTFSIPAHKCGLVIGRGGENVKAINQQTGAFVEISHQPPPNGDPNFKLFTIRGSPQQIDHAKQLIEDKIEGPLCPVGPGPGGPGGPGGPMGPYNPNPYNAGPPGGPPHGTPPGGHQYTPQDWGNTYQQWQSPAPHDPSKAAADHSAAWAAYYAQYYNQQPGGAMPGQAPGTPGGAPGDQSQAAQAPGGQPDYTKAWEEYYKKMGMTQPGGGAAAAAPGTAAPAGAPAAAGGQQDYSAAWAEYYRQQAAYYGQAGQAPGQAPTPQQGQAQ
uniref:KH-type splicing regulatory protein n=1 Tax=Myripristis murdjan TaxID=586833 RepID=A0A667ZMM4_9TELE